MAFSPSRCSLTGAALIKQYCCICVWVSHELILFLLQKKRHFRFYLFHCDIVELQSHVNFTCYSFFFISDFILVFFALYLIGTFRFISSDAVLLFFRFLNLLAKLPFKAILYLHVFALQIFVHLTFRSWNSAELISKIFFQAPTYDTFFALKIWWQTIL